MTLNYQPSIANVVADALSRKSYCNTLLVEKARPALHEEFARLNLEIVPSGFLANLNIASTPEDEIKAANGKMRASSISRRISRVERQIASR